jgi:hypothetical protein
MLTLQGIDHDHIPRMFGERYGKQEVVRPGGLHPDTGLVDGKTAVFQCGHELLNACRGVREFEYFAVVKSGGFLKATRLLTQVALAQGRERELLTRDLGVRFQAEALGSTARVGCSFQLTHETDLT